MPQERTAPSAPHPSATLRKQATVRAWFPVGRLGNAAAVSQVWPSRASDPLCASAPNGESALKENPPPSPATRSCPFPEASASSVSADANG